MKSILIIFLALVALIEFNSSLRNTSSYGKNIKSQNYGDENFTLLDQPLNNRVNHRINHRAGNFLRIEFIITDDYSKDYSPVNYFSLNELSIINNEMTFNRKNFNQLNTFLPFFNQNQKSIQSEFLLI